MNYLNLSTRPRGARFIQYFLVFSVLSVWAFWRSPSYRLVVINMLLVIILMAAIIFIINRWGLVQAEKECRSILSLREYNARLEQSSRHDVLKMLQEKIAASYPVSKLALSGNNVLEGEYNNEKIAVYFIYPDEDGFVETKDIIAILRESRQKSIKVVRVFTAGQYSNKAFSLAERYGIDLKLNDGHILKNFLKGSVLIPTKEEVDTIIKLEIQKRKRRTEIIRKQMLQRKKTGDYLFYSGILFVIVWLEIGAVYWNLIFAFILLALAVLSLMLKKVSIEDEGIF